MEWCGIVPWLALVLLDPAALVLIPGIPRFFPENKLSMLPRFIDRAAA